MKRQKINSAAFIANIVKSTDNIDMFARTKPNLKRWLNEVEKNQRKADVIINIPMASVKLAEPYSVSEPDEIYDVFGILKKEFQDVKKIEVEASIHWHPIQGCFSLIIKKTIKKRSGQFAPPAVTERYFDFEASDGKTNLVFKNGQLVD